MYNDTDKYFEKCLGNQTYNNNENVDIILLFLFSKARLLDPVQSSSGEVHSFLSKLLLGKVAGLNGSSQGAC